MDHVVSSDRNAYDRYYFNAHDRTGEVFLVSGFGVYPNLGVTDAYVTVRAGDRQVTVRMSDAIGADDRLHQQVGAYRIEVIEPLQTVRMVLRPAGAGPQRSTSRGPVRSRRSRSRRHVMRVGGKAILDACRFAQVGTWSGTITVDDQELDVTDDTWVGTPRPLVGHPPGR